MTQPNPDQAAPERAKAPAAKVGNIVAYDRTDPITGAIEHLIGVVVRAAEKDMPHLVRPLHNYAHEVDPADVTSASADDVS